MNDRANQVRALAALLMGLTVIALIVTVTRPVNANGFSCGGFGSIVVAPAPPVVDNTTFNDGFTAEQSAAIHHSCVSHAVQRDIVLGAVLIVAVITAARMRKAVPKHPTQQL